MTGLTFSRDHPRLRGEQACQKWEGEPKMGSPPLARGTEIPPRAFRARRRITPACAGNSSHLYRSRRNGGDHPRLRGEQVYPTPAIPARGGSPPLARGTALDKLKPSWRTRITPACAGNSNGKIGVFLLSRDHPRLRGEQTKKRLVVPCILQYCFSFFNQFFVDMFC